MDTQRMFELYDSMTVDELADRLAELDGERTPAGWTPRTATHRASLERRLVEALGPGPAEARGSLRTELPVRIRSADRELRATIVALGGGAAQVDVPDGWRAGVRVELELDAIGDPAGVVTGRIASVAFGGRARITLDATTSEGQERRLRRLVLAALAHRAAGG